MQTTTPTRSQCGGPLIAFQTFIKIPEYDRFCFYIGRRWVAFVYFPGEIKGFFALFIKSQLLFYLLLVYSEVSKMSLCYAFLVEQSRYYATNHYRTLTAFS